MPWLTEPEAEPDRRNHGLPPHPPPAQCIPPSNPKPNPELTEMMQQAYPHLFGAEKRRRSA